MPSFLNIFRKVRIMAKRAKSTRPESGELSGADLQKAITKIDRRINDLKSFDVNTITERFDARVTALKEKALFQWRK